MGEPGVGKSRLFFEFKAKHQSGWMVLEAPSVSHGKASAFLPLIDLLWSYFKITADDDGRGRREKVTGRVVALERSLEDALPYLYSLLGASTADSPITEVESQTRKRRTLDAVKRILLRESLHQPLIVEFEDLHGVDEETQGFLNLLADGIGTSKIRPSPPSSPSVFAHLGESIEKRVCVRDLRSCMDPENALGGPNP